jgi:hypothetical protein
MRTRELTFLGADAFLALSFLVSVTTVTCVTVSKGTSERVTAEHGRVE